MVEFKGKYQCVSAKNWEAVLEVLGVNMVLRKAATVSKPVMEVSEGADGVWTIKTSTVLRTMELSFKFDQPFDHVSPDGRDVRVTVTRVGDNAIVVEQVAKKDGVRSTKGTREFYDDRVLHTMEVLGTDVVAQFEYKRI